MKTTITPEWAARVAGAVSQHDDAKLQASQPTGVVRGLRGLRFEGDADVLLLVADVPVDEQPIRIRSRVEEEREQERLHAMIVVLGANAAITQDPDAALGTKVFFRLVRDRAREQFVALGGTIDRVDEDDVLTLPTRPELKFYARDIEAMRKLVADYDARLA